MKIIHLEALLHTKQGLIWSRLLCLPNQRKLQAKVVKKRDILTLHKGWIRRNGSRGNASCCPPQSTRGLSEPNMNNNAQNTSLHVR